MRDPKTLGDRTILLNYASSSAWIARSSASNSLSAWYQNSSSRPDGLLFSSQISRARLRMRSSSGLPRSRAFCFSSSDRRGAPLLTAHLFHLIVELPEHADE